MMAMEALRRVIGSVPGYRLAWVAVDGADAVERCRQDTPDLILMDLIMPVMDGAEATRRIMLETPCAILIVTATLEGHSSKVFEALGAGALDVVQTPILGGGGQLEGAAALKVKIASMCPLIGAAMRYASGIAEVAPAHTPDLGLRLIAIGASAGGPEAVATILSGLPSDFPASIVLIQHLDQEFVPSLVSWLNQRSTLHVGIARQGERLRAGTVLLARTSGHLVLMDPMSLGYTPDPRDCIYRPSVDVFFHSVVRHWQGKAAGVLLTGMGKDGSRGLKSLRDAGSFTIAQNSASSVVYGMPRAAADLDAAVAILPVQTIARKLIEFTESHI
jgi:two-component system response regulator WspF